MGEAPDYPPGPRGPEDAESGVRVSMSRDQFEFAAREVAKVPEATSVRFEERGAAYLELTLSREGTELHRAMVFPIPADSD